MYYEVYLDFYFLESFLTDVALLILVKTVMREKWKAKRIAGTAVLESMWSCIELLLPFRGRFTATLFWIVSVLLLVMGGLGKRTAKEVLYGALLLGINPFLTFLVCVPTRILMGWLTGLIYQGLRKTKIPSAASVTIASLCCPLLNTTFFMGTLVTLFASTMRESFGMGKVLPFIFAFVGVNGVVEAIVCFVVGTAISMALKKALRYS